MSILGGSPKTIHIITFAFLEVKLNQVQLSGLMRACVWSVICKCLRSPAVVALRTK